MSPVINQTKTNDFRSNYTNATGLEFNGNELNLLFGLSKMGSPSEMEIHTSIYMTPQTLKVLAHSLTKLIEGYEKSTGQIIPFDQAKFDEITQSLAKTYKTSPTE